MERNGRDERQAYPLLFWRGSKVGVGSNKGTITPNKIRHSKNIAGIENRAE
jgi:hypothetical protein